MADQFKNNKPAALLQTTKIVRLQEIKHKLQKEKLRAEVQ